LIAIGSNGVTDRKLIIWKMVRQKIRMCNPKACESRAPDKV
jgi:hypothetical protein